MATTTTEKSTLVLVDGSFSPEDAHEVLSSLLQSKINYHNNRNFSAEERHGEREEWCDKRLIALRACKQELEQFILEAKASGKKVRVDSKIELTLE